MPASATADASALPGLRERKKRDKRERIVRAARELFREQGFDATTGRQICERAGIGTGTLFLYVRDKRELLFLIFRPLAERTFARLPDGLAPDEGAVDGWMRLFGAFYRLYGRDPRLARLFLQELFFRDDPGEGMVALNGVTKRFTTQQGLPAGNLHLVYAGDDGRLWLGLSWAYILVRSREVTRAVVSIVACRR